MNTSVVGASMDPTTVVMVWWLVLGGSGNAGSSWSPVPYQSEAVCNAAADVIEQADYPIISAVCVPQPAADVAVFANQFYGYNVPVREYGYGR